MSATNPWRHSREDEKRAGVPALLSKVRLRQRLCAPSQVNYMDDLIAEVVAAFKRKGLWEDLLWASSSDNGASVCACVRCLRASCVVRSCPRHALPRGSRHTAPQHLRLNSPPQRSLPASMSRRGEGGCTMHQQRTLPLCRWPGILAWYKERLGRGKQLPASWRQVEQLG